MYLFNRGLYEIKIKYLNICYTHVTYISIRTFAYFRIKEDPELLFSINLYLLVYFLIVIIITDKTKCLLMQLNYWLSNIVLEMEVVQQNILIIDHNPFSCYTENCNQLTELIQSSFFLQQFRFQTTTLFPREPSTFSPDLIIFRPAKEAFAEALFSIKKNWGKAPVVCLFYNGWNTSSEIFQSFHRSM